MKPLNLFICGQTSEHKVVRMPQWVSLSNYRVGFLVNFLVVVKSDIKSRRFRFYLKLEFIFKKFRV